MVRKSPPNVVEILKISKWLDKNRQAIAELRPTRDELAKLIESETGMGIGYVSLRHLLEELKIAWVPRRSTASNSQETLQALQDQQQLLLRGLLLVAQATRPLLAKDKGSPLSTTVLDDLLRELKDLAQKHQAESA